MYAPANQYGLFYEGDDLTGTEKLLIEYYNRGNILRSDKSFT